MMKNNTIAIWSIVLICVSMFLLSQFSKTYYKSNLSEWLSTAPIFFLSKAQLEFNRHHIYDATEMLQKATHAMQSIERYSTPDANSYVDKSIFELQKLTVLISQENISETELNQAYFRCINSVAYAELRISEKEFLEGQYLKPLGLMNTVLILLNKSITYIKDENSAYLLKEKSIIKHVHHLIDQIEKTGKLDAVDYEKVNQEIRDLLDSFELEYY
ncbi:hypothetical protein SAMN04488029_0017 [Reichenbachiella faecimaris]|uniref:Uncharacterized protein n=1 Tax=Reichenbachiella faecimaris TaxID=692418 RepID=A0A1W2G548_REIFA|nr:hypothetical protein [Reichenbachiella faecimaris]SMD31654.1 hypothetical protein SAMN04488029_0017 [Reichenbachiella faecimaris]